MPRSGPTYTLPEAAFVPNTPISSAAVNSDLSDIADALTGSLARTGAGGMLAVLPLDNTGFDYLADPNTGMSRSAADTQVITCGGVNVLTATSTAVDVLDLKLNGTEAFPVPTAQIAAGAVTYAKIQNVAAVSLLGNATGSSAVTEEITLGTGLSFVGTVLTPTISALLMPNYLSGLTLSYVNTTTFGIAAGVANDTTSASLMRLASAYTKTTSAWAVGTGNGGLDTGSIGAASWYHVYLIQRPDTGVVDVMFSLSATFAGTTPPANYTLGRRIGSIKTSSSQWVQFSQVGDTFIWNTTVADSFTANLAAGTLTLAGVPTGVVVTALGRVTTQAGGTNVVIITSLLESDQFNSSTLADMTQQVAGTTAVMNAQRITNTSAQIRVRANNNGITCEFNTYGWTDLRGRLG